ncbi:MAG: hypothetical protein IPK82_08185 [Polyangiaceae bacterium]|nr:hypothetical protein [Polyangiaceae bacterium]
MGTAFGMKDLTCPQPNDLLGGIGITWLSGGKMPPGKPPVVSVRCRQRPGKATCRLGQAPILWGN